MGREVKDDGNMGDVHPMANKTFIITAVLVIINKHFLASVGKVN